MLWFYLLPSDPSPRKLVLTGVSMGLACLLNPAVAIVGVVGLCWIWIRLRGAWPARHWKPGLAAAVCFLVMLPWMVRNTVMVGEFAPRTAGGIQLRLGNNEIAWKSGTALYTLALYAADSAAEGKRLRDLGEAAYDRECRREAIEFIRHNPGRFLGLTALRIRNWWIGYDSIYTAHFHGFSNVILPAKRLAGSLWLPFFLVGAVLAARRGYPVCPVLAVILLYPLPYYVCFVCVRYRFPIEPLVLIFVAYCLTEFWDKLRKHALPAPQPQPGSIKFTPPRTGTN
jgi:4-amino-4-deoxy-L-arabinose transferase-like glycosyltransferase